MTETTASDVAYPDRAEDGCTYCGMVLSVTNKDGSLNVEASEAAQREHQKNTGCAATPAYTDPNASREIDAKTGRLDGEYDINKPRSAKGASEDDINALIDKRLEALSDDIEKSIDAKVAEAVAAATAPTDDSSGGGS